MLVGRRLAADGGVATDGGEGDRVVDNEFAFAPEADTLRPKALRVELGDGEGAPVTLGLGRREEKLGEVGVIDPVAPEFDLCTDLPEFESCIRCDVLDALVVSALVCRERC